jgi:hypothetical protein
MIPSDFYTDSDIVKLRIASIRCGGRENSIGLFSREGSIMTICFSVIEYDKQAQEDNCSLGFLEAQRDAPLLSIYPSSHSYEIKMESVH